MKATGIFFILLLTTYSSFSQTHADKQADTISEKMRFYNQKNAADVLFAHFDKTIYANSENAWFTAYLLNSNKTDKSSVLSVSLVRDNDHSIVLHEKFVMARGIAFGDMLLPDTIASGNYSFVLYTNSVINDKPTAIFTQAITIKNTTPTSFNAFLQLIDTGRMAPGGVRRVQLVTDTRGSKIISGIPVSWYLGNKLHPRLGGKVKTDPAGQYLFEIPVSNIELGGNLLEAQISYGKEVKTVRLVLPVPREVPVVKFYPEGGNLAAGVMNTVGWEVQNAVGNPIKAVGVLYNNSRPLDTIYTNNYGMGRFRFLPDAGSRYHVKLLASQGVDSVYALPPALPGYPAVSLLNSVADDTLSLIIKSQQPRHFIVAVHNYQHLFFLFPIEVNATWRPVKIVLADIPKGIVEVTVLDSLFRPYAERLFFAHYKQHAEVDIKTDARVYQTRQRVRLKLKLHGDDGKPVSGLVSVACVQASRLDPEKTNDIESWFYLADALGALRQRAHHGYTAADKAWLEDVLLVKGWRRYAWPAMMKATAADTVAPDNNLNFKGSVTRFGKPLKKPVELVLMKKSGIVTIQTDEKGGFILRDSDLFEVADKKIYFFVGNKDNDDYDFTMIDPYKHINQLVASNLKPVEANYQFTSGQKADEDDLAGSEHAIHLREVKIRDNATVYSFARNANACGDYVCRYGILNCRNHPNESDNRQPIPGETYIINGMQQRYAGCTAAPHSNHTFKGIYYSMQFYGSDYGQSSPSQPEYVSTIFWRHLCKVDAGAEAELSFYTSDITGPFKIIVQGITPGDVVYGEQTFNVVKRK